MSSQPATNAILAGVPVVHLGFEKPLVRIENEIAALESEQQASDRDMAADIKQLRIRLTKMTKRMYSHLTAWETVQVARHPARPLVTDYISRCFRDFCELHGDRYYGDDQAMMTGFGRIGPYKVMLVGHNKGKDTEERIACNFGCAHPEGYRKSLRMMKLAEKYGLPVVCLIDTQGAFPGIGSEERGISRAIAVNLMEMSRLRTQVVCVVIGEGGSGGALGIGVGDCVAMFEHSFYSVISPEGCAAILWRTGEERERAAESLKLSAKELKKLSLIDQVLPEPLGGAHRDPAATAQTLETYLVDSLRELRRFKIDTVLRKRYERIRNLGSFFESTATKAKPRSREGKPAADGRSPRIRSGRGATRLTP